MKNQIRRVTPVAYAHDHVRLEPPVIPLLFLSRLKVRRMYVHAELLKTSVKKVPLRG
jgi:hypothetical protein